MASMASEVYYAGAGVLTYLLGAVPFGLIVVWILKGVDLRTLGSGNIGATNAGREFGWVYFALIFTLDLAKGFAPVFFLSPWIAEHYPCPRCPALEPSMAAWLALCAVSGHMFPVYLKFKGGKGVATGLGVSLALNWQASIIAFGVFLIVLLLFRYVSLSSVLAAVALPVAHLFTAEEPWTDRVLITSFFLLAGALVVLKHRGNLKRLAGGTEPKAFAS
jgi:glycerol-3-phosphate acyltransferase PlsY